MKYSARRTLLPALCFIALTNKGTTDPAPQAYLQFTQGVENTFNADWEGATERTYFMQFSLDLETWHFAPFIDFGEGDHQRGIHSTSEKFFLRLNYIDFPNIHSLKDAMSADFDGDGLSNIFEVMNGYSPHEIDSNDAGIPDGAVDLDEDGTLTILEQNTGRDPKVKDHPSVKLSAIVGN